MFALVGSAGTAIQYTVLGLSVALGAAHPVVGSAVGYALGSVANYLLNYRFTFQCKAPHAQAATKYFTILAVGWLINLCLMSLFVVGIGWSHWTSQVLATAMGLAWNYSGSNWWAYRVRGNTPGSAASAERSSLNDRAPAPLPCRQEAHRRGRMQDAPLAVQ